METQARKDVQRGACRPRSQAAGPQSTSLSPAAVCGAATAAEPGALPTAGPLLTFPCSFLFPRVCFALLGLGPEQGADLQIN